MEAEAMELWPVEELARQLLFLTPEQKWEARATVGVLTDAELAELFDVSPIAIGHERMLHRQTVIAEAARRAARRRRSRNARRQR